MYLLKLLIILVLIIFPFGELLRVDIGNNITIRPLDIIIVLTAGWWLCLSFKKINFSKLKNTEIVFPLLIFVFIGFLSLIINLSWLSYNHFLPSFFYLLRFISYAAIFFIVSKFDTKFKKKILNILFIDGLVILLAGFIQYFFYNSLKNLFYLGWDEHMHRIFSTFFDPNFAGAFYVLYSIFIAGLILNSIRKKEKNKSIGLSFILLITFIAIFLTFSRAALLMLIVGAIIFLILINKKKILLFLFALIILFVFIASFKFGDENMNLFREASSIARIANYELALKVIQDHPLIGVGFNSYRYTKDLYKLKHDWTNAPSHADAGVDNSFLFVLATTGIVGFIVYLWLWINILKRGFYLHKKKKKIAAVVVISSVIALFINALFINSLFYSSLMFWMWLQIGLIEEY